MTIRRIKRTIYLLLTAPVWIPVVGCILWLSQEENNPYELRFQRGLDDNILESEWNCYKFKFRSRPWFLR